jgi:flavin reductase (DIM6/NTAB) family NADH-FMN oxidoreductase RutF
MAITSEAFRDALRHFPAGVTIVTIKSGEEVHGLTVSAFASVSPEPPLILICIDNRHHAQELLKRDGASFAVSILRQGQHELSNRFAYVKDEDRFAVGDWRVAATGAPVLADSLAWLDCTVFCHKEAGTHTIYVGEVQASAVPHPDEAPLIYWNRAYRALTK